MIAESILSRASTPSYQPAIFTVADQGRVTYRLHHFDSFEHFRDWARAHRPAHMRPPSFASGTRQRPDVDHRGDFDEAMQRVVAQDDAIAIQRERSESARRESFERRRNAPPLRRLGHQADADLVAVADAAQSARRVERKDKAIKSTNAFFNWCTDNGINWDHIRAYLGMSLRDWMDSHPHDPFGSAIVAILERRDAQAHPIEV